MAPLDSALRKQPGEPAPPYRAAPHNIEAEQALLGAVLVNNEALYRVSDFLEPQHFFEPIHQQIYDISRSLIRTGKLASPVTLKTFLPAETDIAGLTLAQYLARLAAEATTIINAVDYGRTIYDLAIRRELINIGEDMVNVASMRRSISRRAIRSRMPSAACMSSRRSAVMAAAFRNSTPRSPPPSTWRRAPISAKESSRGWQRVSKSSIARWAACSRPT